MAAATAITVQETPGVFLTGSYTLDPADLADGATASDTVAVPGVKVGDLVLVQPRADLAVDLTIQSAFVDAAGSLTVFLYNISGGSINLGSTTFDFAVFRGRNTNVASG